MSSQFRQRSTLALHRCDGVLVVCLNRPKALNAINRTMREELRQTLGEAQRDGGISALVLTASGRAFCAGHDIKELLALSPSAASAVMLEIGDLYRDLRAFSKPLVTALNGLALGGGVALALLSDARLAIPDFEFGFPEIDHGLVTALGPWLLGLFLPPALAHQIVLSGARLSAEQCTKYGLVSERVEPNDLLSKAISCASSLAEKPQSAFSIMKARFAAVTDAGFHEALAAGAGMQEVAHAARLEVRSHSQKHEHGPVEGIRPQHCQRSSS
ncbi:enoyl-CoA hydratase/isomerase family protein (plasmid) [Variovorax sp. V59]|uniref:enoyl-CoA hydratase/isomerase family protein n=1 Tax=unclassified Variovorax TaxID=663243 RepID=UPI0034E8C464